MTTENSERPAKRPLGLKKLLESSKAAKKAKHESEMTVEIDESIAQDDFQELKMIYESALNSYEKSREDSERNGNEGKEKSSLMLFRGVVHECDKMIRIRQDNPKEAVPQATEEELALLLERIKDNKVLPQQFHLIYANALFYLSILEDEKSDDTSNQSSAAFLDESIYRIQIALEMDYSNTNAHFSYARSLIQKVILGADQCTPSVCGTIEKEIEFVFESLSANLNLACELTHLYSELLDMQTTIQGKIDWTVKVANYWGKIVAAEETNSKSIIGLASTWLTIADVAIEYLEENPTTKAVSSEMIQEFLKKAISFFEQVKNVAAVGDKFDESFIQSQIMLGECHVHLGNLLDTDPVDEEENGASADNYQDTQDNDCQESVSHYRLAMECFQKVQEVQPGALPDHFEEFLADWLKDFQEE